VLRHIDGPLDDTVAGQPLEEFFGARIFEPLGMKANLVAIALTQTSDFLFSGAAAEFAELAARS
jgi:CubicO group peptidase (beta-lactamase class C family)